MCWRSMFVAHTMKSALQRFELPFGGPQGPLSLCIAELRCAPNGIFFYPTVIRPKASSVISDALRIGCLTECNVLQS